MKDILQCIWIKLWLKLICKSAWLNADLWLLWSCNLWMEKLCPNRRLQPFVATLKQQSFLQRQISAEREVNYPSKYTCDYIVQNVPLFKLVQCTFLGLWTIGHILTKVCCRVNFSNTWSSTCTAHCAGSRWRSQWNEKKYHISALLESQFGRYGLGDSD